MGLWAAAILRPRFGVLFRGRRTRTRTKDLSMTEAIQQFIQRGRATAKAAPTSGLLRFFQDCRRRREEALISCLSKTLRIFRNNTTYFPCPGTNILLWKAIPG